MGAVQFTAIHLKVIEINLQSISEVMSVVPSKYNSC